MEKPLQILTKWRDRARTNQKVHYAQEENLRFWYYCLGVPAIFSGVFASALSIPLYKLLGECAIYIFTAISFIAALLTAFLTFFRLSERATQHHSAALRYGKLYRQIESILAQPLPEGENLAKLLNTIEKDLNAASDVSPLIPFNSWDKVPKHITSEKHDA
jgi:hypothetical protein